MKRAATQKTRSIASMARSSRTIIASSSRKAPAILMSDVKDPPEQIIATIATRLVILRKTAKILPKLALRMGTLLIVTIVAKLGTLQEIAISL